MITLEEKTIRLKQRLREQSDLAYKQKTEKDMFYVMYGFVEIIENDPVFFEFIKTKINEENKIHKEINDSYKRKEIDKEYRNDLLKLHIAGKFYHGYYSLFKDAHDSIKIDICHALGIKADKLMQASFFSLDASEPRFSKILTKEMFEFYTDDFEKCLEKINELINLDQKLLIEINDKYNMEHSESQIKEMDNKKDTNTDLKITYNSQNKMTIIEYKKEKIIFETRRASIIKFFYDNKDKNNITYKDYQKWLKDNKIKDYKINSVKFRQDIKEINKRIKKEKINITGIIKITNKNKHKKTEINLYKFEVLYK